MLSVPLRLVGLVLLFWTFPLLATIALLFVATTNRRDYRLWALIKNDGIRAMVEVMGSASAAIGFWFFPHFHPVVGQALAVLTVVTFLMPALKRYQT